MKSSLLSPPSTEKSMLRPELPPKETAVMRALVGSEGSTGAVNGAMMAMLAKLRAESGTSSRSSEVMTVCTTLLPMSSGWLASEGPRSWTSTDWRRDSGARVIRTESWALMETAMRCVWDAKPVAATAMEYVAGVSARKRASPRESVICESWVADFSSERTTRAVGIAPLEESRTSTRSEPRNS